MPLSRGRGLLGSWYTSSTAGKGATTGWAAVADRFSEGDTSSTSRLSAVDTLPCSSPVSPVCRVPSSDNYESGESRAGVYVPFGRAPSWQASLLESPNPGMSAAAAAREQPVRAQHHLKAIQRWYPGFDQLNGPIPHAPRFSGKSTMVFLCLIPTLGRQEQKHAYCILAQ